MPEIHLPENLELGRQVGTLVGRTARVFEIDGRNKFDESCHVAYYVTREDELAGFCVVDLPLSAFLGAALAMIPAGTAEEVTKRANSVRIFLMRTTRSRTSWQLCFVPTALLAFA